VNVDDEQTAATLSPSNMKYEVHILKTTSRVCCATIGLLHAGDDTTAELQWTAAPDPDMSWYQHVLILVHRKGELRSHLLHI